MNHALIFSCKLKVGVRGGGAHRIATVLREHGWDVEVIDYAAYWPLELLKELVKSRVHSGTVFIGFSTFFNYWNDNLNKFSEWIKQKYPNIKTVIGGQSVALTPANHIEYWIDSFGENAILELVKSFTGNSTQPIKYDLSSFGSKKLIKSLHSYPAYPLNSYKVIMENRDYLEPWEWVGTEFSRGCKFSCDFCNFPILGIKGDYSRDQEDFEYEMRYNYDNFGITNYLVADETFNDRVEKIEKFANVAERLEFRPFFSGFVRADLMIAKPESWEQFKRLNFLGHYYGIESFNYETAKVVGKGMHPDRLKEGLIDAKNYFLKDRFYRGTISLIVGLPHETKDTLEQTERWMIDNWKDQAALVFPLDIDDLEISGSTLTNDSKISKNYSKYGYRRMKEEDAKAQFSEFSKPIFEGGYSGWQPGIAIYGNTGLIWENDHMTWFDSRRISDKMNRSLVINNPLGAWDLAESALLTMKKLNDISETDKFVTDDVVRIGEKEIRLVVYNYIRKKLSKQT